MQNKIFIDCGLYDGVAIKQYVFDDSWKIYSFEPNTKYDYQSVLDRLPKLELIQKAVWTENGQVTFGAGIREDASHIIGMTSHPTEEPVTVPAIDFSAWVTTLPKGPITCSMDIEGAEFPVLRKMLDEHTIDQFSVLDVEFHHRAMADYDTEDARKLIKEITDRGVIVRVKVVLE